jgi:hypothetical protein
MFLLFERIASHVIIFWWSFFQFVHDWFHLAPYTVFPNVLFKKGQLIEAK